MTNQLESYQIEKQITSVEYQAALMFFADHETAREYLRMRRTAARPGAERYRRACHELGGLRAVVHAVTMANLGCSTWAYEAGLRRAEGMTQLREGLAKLATFYAGEAVEAAE